MSLRLVIPWRVALQQSSPPLHQPMAILNEEPEFEKFKILTASVPIENCLNRGVHPKVLCLLCFFVASHLSGTLEPHRMTTRPSPVKIVLAFAAVYTLWGSTYLAIRLAIETLPPFLMTGTRFTLAGLILFVWAVLKGERFIPPLDLWRRALVIGGLLLLGGNGGVVWSERYVATGLAALLVSTEPLWVVILNWAISRQRPNWKVLLGILIGLVGVAMLVGDGLRSNGQSKWTVVAGGGGEVNDRARIGNDRSHSRLVWRTGDGRRLGVVDRNGEAAGWASAGGLFAAVDVQHDMHAGEPDCGCSSRSGNTAIGSAEVAGTCFSSGIGADEEEVAGSLAAWREYLNDKFRTSRSRSGYRDVDDGA